MLEEMGVRRVRLLLQGVDHKLFARKETIRRRKGPILFSGGKFETRKGQDVVVSAFRHLRRQFPTVTLLVGKMLRFS